MASTSRCSTIWATKSLYARPLIRPGSPFTRLCTARDYGAKGAFLSQVPQRNPAERYQSPCAQNCTLTVMPMKRRVGAAATGGASGGPTDETAHSSVLVLSSEVHDSVPLLRRPDDRHLDRREVARLRFRRYHARL